MGIGIVAGIGWGIYKSNEPTSGLAGKATNSGIIPHGGYLCMDGARPCSWNGNYCPCNLVATTEAK